MASHKGVPTTMKSDVRVCADVNELSRRAAEAAVTTVNDAVRGNGRCSLVTEVRIGANVDDSEVANAGETGQTTDAPRDEVRPLE